MSVSDDDLRDKCSVRGQPHGPKGGIISNHAVLCHVASMLQVFIQSPKRVLMAGSFHSSNILMQTAGCQFSQK